MFYLLFLLLPLLLYAVFARIIIFHLNRYSINESVTKNITAVFVVISLILAILTSLAFFAIPWDTIKLDNFANYLDSLFGQNQSQNINIKF